MEKTKQELVKVSEMAKSLNLSETTIRKYLKVFSDELLKVSVKKKAITYYYRDILYDLNDIKNWITFGFTRDEIKRKLREGQR